MFSSKDLQSLIKKRESKSVKSVLETSEFRHPLNTLGGALLCYSAKYGDADLVKYLLDKGYNVNAQDSRGRTALMSALKRRRTEVIQILLNAKADPSVLDHQNKSAIHIICAKHHLRPKLKLAIFRRYRWQFPSSEIAAKKLIDAGCHLYQAAYTKDAKVLVYMLERGYSVNATIPRSKTTALHVAVSLENVSSVKVLLKYGADVNAVDKEGCSPLFYVYRIDDTMNNINKLRILELLLNRGASPSMCDKYGHFQADFTLESGWTPAISLVLSHWDFAAKSLLRGQDVLHFLATSRHPGVIDELNLYLHNINVNALNEAGWSPLHVAAFCGIPRMIEFLLDHGADVNHATNYNGNTALRLAYEKARPEIEKEFDECIEILLQNGADPQWSEKYDEGFTIFDVALDSECHGYERLEPVIAQLAILEGLGTPIKKVIRVKISSRPEWQLYYDRCRRVLCEEIRGTMTLLKLLTDSERNLEKYAGNKDLLRKVKRISDEYTLSSSFSYYHNMLKKRFSRGIELRRLRDEAAGSICRLFGGRIGKTYVVASRVSDYLSDQDFL